MQLSGSLEWRGSEECVKSPGKSTKSPLKSVCERCPDDSSDPYKILQCWERSLCCMDEARELTTWVPSMVMPF